MKKPKTLKFKTGAIRNSSEDKGAYELISPIFTAEIAKVLETGARVYTPRNWEKGIEIGRNLQSAKRHLDNYLEGHRFDPNKPLCEITNERHLAQACVNIMFIIHIEEMIKRGLLPKHLDNLPNYLPKPKKSKKKKKK